MLEKSDFLRLWFEPLPPVDVFYNVNPVVRIIGSYIMALSCLRNALRMAFWGLMWFVSMSVSGLYAQLRVDTIRVEGNRVTEPWVVLRELTFEPGDTLANEKLTEVLERNRLNIANLNIFSQVNLIPEVIEGRLSLKIQVKERFRLGGSVLLTLEERNSYDMLVALQSRDFSRLVYGEQFTWRNITGKGEELQWDILWGFSRRVHAEFRKPLVGRNPAVDLQIGVRYDWQPEIIVGTSEGRVHWEGLHERPLQQRYGGYVSLQNRQGIYHQFEVQLGYDSYQLDDSLYTLDLEGRPISYLTNNSGREHLNWVMLRMAVDKRDWNSYPLRGYKGQIMGRMVGGPLSTTRFVKLGGSWAHHIPMGSRFYFAYGFTSILTLGDSLPFFEKSQIGIRRPEFPGISNGVRGYQPYVIDGTWLSLGKTELKYAVIPYRMVSMDWLGIPQVGSQALALYLTAFADVGYVRDDSFSNYDQWLKNQALYGYGVGVNLIVMYDLLWRVEYARNHLGQGGIYFHGTLPIK